MTASYKSCQKPIILRQRSPLWLQAGCESCFFHRKRSYLACIPLKCRLRQKTKYSWALQAWWCSLPRFKAYSYSACQCLYLVLANRFFKSGSVVVNLLAGIELVKRVTTPTGNKLGHIFMVLRSLKIMPAATAAMYYTQPVQNLIYNRKNCQISSVLLKYGRRQMVHCLLPYPVLPEGLSKQGRKYFRGCSFRSASLTGNSWMHRRS